MSDKRSILVSGIPSHATRDELEIHFQKRRNGGGDVASLIYPVTGTPTADFAVITFETPEVAKRVLETPQKFGGVHLGTRPLREQVFHRITAEIKRDLVDGIPGARHALQWQYGLSCLETELDGQKCYAVRGTWFQIEAARVFLENRSGLGESQGQSPKSKEGAAPSEDISSRIWRHMATGEDDGDWKLPFNPSSGSDASTRRGARGEWTGSIGKPELEAAAYASERHDEYAAMSGREESDIMSNPVMMAMMMEDVGDDVEDSEADNIPNLQVDADVYNYLKMAHVELLKKLQDECKVELKCDDGKTITSVRIVPSSDDTKPMQIRSAKQRFVSLYESTFHTIQKYDLHAPERITDPEKLQKAARDTQTNMSDVYVKQENDDQFSIYGTATSIARAKTYFYNQLADRVREPPSRSWEADLSDKIRDMEPLTPDEKPKPKEEVFASLLTKIREAGPIDPDPETVEGEDKDFKPEDKKDATTSGAPPSNPTEEDSPSIETDKSDSAGDDVIDHTEEDALEEDETAKDGVSKDNPKDK